jgi:NAD(P)-dependent dehydrogenase (short-subunit alcohol dehydrogenase family)
MTRLADRVALVTGGGSGIGLASVRLFALEGARVVVVDIREETGRAAAEEVGGRFIPADVGRAESWTLIAEVVAREFGRLDVALLNAGRGVGDGDIRALSDDLYRRVLAVNLDGVVLGTRALVPLMEAAGGGQIVITSSTAALGHGSDPIYALTKAGQLGFVRDIAPRLEPLGIAINALLPHVVDTPLLPPAIREQLQQAGIALLSPDEVADAAMHAITSGETGQSWVCLPQQAPQRYVLPAVPSPLAPE